MGFRLTAKSCGVPLKRSAGVGMVPAVGVFVGFENTGRTTLACQDLEVIMGDGRIDGQDGMDD